MSPTRPHPYSQEEVEARDRALWAQRERAVELFYQDPDLLDDDDAADFDEELARVLR
jgi:hypothetical protein